MTRANSDFDDPIRTVGADATASFDNGPSNPTEHAGSEALGVPADGDNEDSIVESDDQVEPDGLEDESDVDGEELLHEDDHEMPGDDAL